MNFLTWTEWTTIQSKEMAEPTRRSPCWTNVIMGEDGYGDHGEGGDDDQWWRGHFNRWWWWLPGPLVSSRRTWCSQWGSCTGRTLPDNLVEIDKLIQKMMISVKISVGSKNQMMILKGSHRDHHGKKRTIGWTQWWNILKVHWLLTSYLWQPPPMTNESALMTSMSAGFLPACIIFASIYFCKHVFFASIHVHWMSW